MAVPEETLNEQANKVLSPSLLHFFFVVASCVSVWVSVCVVFGVAFSARLAWFECVVCVCGAFVRVRVRVLASLCSLPRTSSRVGGGASREKERGEREE